MDEKQFEVKGTYREKPDFWKPFTKILTAPNPTQAKERIFSTIGSKHRLARSYIKIETVSEVSGE